MTLRWFTVLALFLFSLVSLLSADEVILKSGITIKGRVTERNMKQVVIESSGREMPYNANDVAEVKLDPYPEFELGDKLLLQGDVSGAASAFEKVVRGDRRLFREDARAKLVFCYLQMNRTEEAVSTFLAMLEQSPDSRHKLAFPWQYSPALRDPSSALALISKRSAAVSIAPALEAWTLLASGKAAEAQRKISFLLSSKDPILKELGLILQLRLLFDARKFDECLKLASDKKGEIREPGRAWVYYWRGRCLIDKQDYLRAALALLRVGTLYPINESLAGDSLYLAGQCFEKMGRMDRAKKEYLSTVGKFPISMAADLARKRAAAIQ